MNIQAMQKRKDQRAKIGKRTRNQLLLLAAMGVFLLVFYFVTNGKLLRPANIKSIAASTIFLILSGYGMMFVFEAA